MYKRTVGTHHSIHTLYKTSNKTKHLKSKFYIAEAIYKVFCQKF